MDLYSRLAPHLQITEITVPAYSNEAEDEKIQAELIKYLYTLWFSHPSVEQIIYWNLIDGYAYVADPTPEKIRRSQGDMSIGENVYYGGLLRYDMSPKPAFYVIDRLVNHEWRTNAEYVGDTLSLRAFFGKYELTVNANGRSVKNEIDLSKDTDCTFEIVI